MSEPEPELRVVLVTAPDEETGLRLARAMVEERLVACANLVPGVRSVYRWEGKLQEDAEVLLVMKTTAERIRLLTERVNALHPYDLPEVLALPTAGGSAAYLEWVAAETRS